ncbi:dUTP diphosphatase [Microscilla marina]|uniref:dUTP diphosphatase n=1 Tax=Microscilla marina ATCC 23134 TaxID=313606 RepID=A1ZNZ5_MICM2|nr:deoxyuridine 5'-triphosphate nucleotidohydrolase family [Microscilla marina]EAY27787.1 deoxyuridine 5'-triphosphate nucleotidohydrolase family [Microscilla marina ATCC 23134]
MSLANNFFSDIDTEGKAYCLGWIAANGIVDQHQVELRVAYQQVRMLEVLRSIIDKELPIGEIEDANTGRQAYLKLESDKIAQSVCQWLQVSVEDQYLTTAKLPAIEHKFLQWSFIRGVFDAYGNINLDTIEFTLTTRSENLLYDIKAFCKIPAEVTNTGELFTLNLQRNNALDFLGNLYDHASYGLEANQEIYARLCALVPGFTAKISEKYPFKWVKALADAVPPFKERVSDSGYDLTLVKKVKEVGDVTFFDTGIKVQPGYGWYFDLVPRSSISKTGYMLANSVGVIDRTYTGNVLVPLRKVDVKMPDLDLPARIVQIIPRPIVHVQWQQVEDFDETARGEGGFGSTNT